jgi:hypothetical protein
VNARNENGGHGSVARRWSRAGLRRWVVLTAGLTGALALLAEPVQAGVTMQHCEPLQRR